MRIRLGLVVPLAIAVGCTDSGTHRPSGSVVTTSTPEAVVVKKVSPEEAYQALLVRAEPHLSWAQEESNTRATRHLDELDEFFVTAKAGVPEFASDANGWYAKYFYIRQMTSFFAKGKYFDEYIADSLARNVITADSLGAEVQATVETYLADLKSIDDEMLVKQRADIADLNLEGFEPLTDEEIDARYAALRTEALTRAKNLNLRTTLESVGAEVAGQIAGFVLTQVLVKMGVFGATTGVGAAGAPFTLGLSLAAGLAVGVIVDYAWSWFSDPEGDLVEKVNLALEEIRANIRGDETSGMQAAFAGLADERSELRRQVIEDFCREASQR